jgi:hypothetical protein
VHRQLREEITDLDTQTLNWTPGPNTNTICPLIIHPLGSEAEMLRRVTGHPNDRNRIAVFVARISQRDELLYHFDAADTDLERLRPSITEREFFTLRARPKKPPQSGLLGLVRNYGNAREHLGQLQLTKQLYSRRP